MPTVTKAADRHTIVTTGWTNPSNAYQTSGDNVYATATPGKNSTVNGDFGFPALTAAGELPAGAIITAVRIVVEWGMTASVNGGTLGVQGRNGGVADSAAEITKTTIVEAQSTFSFATLPSVADLHTAGRVVGRVRCSKGNTTNAMTGNLDFVRLEVDYVLPSLGQPTETDIAQSTSRLKQRALAQPAETDVAQPSQRLKQRALAQPAEPETAQPIGGVKARTSAQAASGEGALPVAPGMARALGQAAEAEVAAAASADKSRVPTQTSENDLAQTAHPAKSASAALASEASIGHQIVPAKSRPLGQVTESTASLSVSARKRMTLPTAASQDNAGLIARGKQSAIGQALALELPSPFAVSKLALAALTGEANLAQQIIPLSSGGGAIIIVGQAAELEQAALVAALKQRLLTSALELDEALVIAPLGTQPVAVAGRAGRILRPDRATAPLGPRSGRINRPSPGALPR